MITKELKERYKKICRDKKETKREIRQLGKQRIKQKIYKHRVLCLWGLALVFIAMAIVYAFYLADSFRLDQYMSAICTTTATLTVTMFGLTAASYAFVCSEVRTEENARPHLKCILDDYRADLWGQFLFGLALTSETVFFSLLCLGIAQSFSASDLFILSHQNNGSLLGAYANSDFCIISGLTALNIEFALAAILVMIFHNIMIFKREDQYSTLAKNLLEEKVAAYSFPESLESKRSEID